MKRLRPHCEYRARKCGAQISPASSNASSLDRQSVIVVGWSPSVIAEIVAVTDTFVPSAATLDRVYTLLFADDDLIDMPVPLSATVAVPFHFNTKSGSLDL